MEIVAGFFLGLAAAHCAYLLGHGMGTRRAVPEKKWAPHVGEAVEFEVDGFTYVGVFAGYRWADLSEWRVRLWDGEKCSEISVPVRCVVAVSVGSSSTADPPARKMREPTTYRN